MLVTSVPWLPVTWLCSYWLCGYGLLTLRYTTLFSIVVIGQWHHRRTACCSLGSSVSVVWGWHVLRRGLGWPRTLFGHSRYGWQDYTCYWPSSCACTYIVTCECFLWLCLVVTWHTFIYQSETEYWDVACDWVLAIRVRLDWKWCVHSTQWCYPSFFLKTNCTHARTIIVLAIKTTWSLCCIWCYCWNSSPCLPWPTCLQKFLCRKIFWRLQVGTRLKVSEYVFWLS